MLCDSSIKNTTLMLIISTLLLCSLGLMVAAQSAAPVLNSTLQPGEPVYPGQEIIFCCETRGSLMAWQSDQYIGNGGSQLEFIAPFDSINKTLLAQANQNTVATLISVHHQSNGYVLVTKLRIIVLASVSTATVTCLNIDNNNSTEKSFILSKGT